MSSLSPLPTTLRLRRSVQRTALATAGVLLLLAACSHYRGSVPSPDIGMAKLSAHQLYRAAVRPSAVPIPVRSLQVWTLHVETAEGSPVDAATITMNGGMPQHGHGLPTKPRVTRELGNGDHLVEGMKFNMGGWWVVKFRVNAAQGTDSLVFNLKL